MAQGTWSLSNQTIDNKRTQVDKRLTTITPQNPTGFVTLNPNSNDRLIKELEYSIRTDGVVVYRIPSLNNRQFNDIQQIADAGFPGYNDTTTLKIKNDLTNVFRNETENKIIKGTGISPFAQTSPSDQEGGVKIDLDAEGLSTLTIEANTQTQVDFGGIGKVWRYPIGESDQDVIKFTMIEYTPPSGLNVEGNKFTGRIEKNKQEGTPLGTVILPIQPTIVDNNSVGWQQDTLNPLELAALDLSLGTITGGIAGAKESIERIVGSVTGDMENVKKGIFAGAASAAIGKNVIARVTGAILNPNIELLFNAPILRSFNYRFQLSAREKKETDQILGIIGWFKRGMAVRRTPAELFLSTPNVFNIQYLYKNADEHPYINRIKTCALTNCSVDYTPTGSYMTFGGDGSMVSYTINLTFDELEPIYQDDYKPVGTQIGY
jgi:hypothetical protein